MQPMPANKSVSTLLALMYVSAILDLGLMGASAKVWSVERSILSAACSSFLHLEIHECNEDDHTCQHICNNTHGSFVCSCFNGYSLASNGFSCNGITIMYFRIFELHTEQFSFDRYWWVYCEHPRLWPYLPQHTRLLLMQLSTGLHPGSEWQAYLHW